jgi:lysozyme
MPAPFRSVAKVGKALSCVLTRSSSHPRSLGGSRTVEARRQNFALVSVWTRVVTMVPPSLSCSFVLAVAVICSIGVQACATRQTGHIQVRSDHFVAGDLLKPSEPSAARGPEPRPIIASGIDLTKCSEGWVPPLYHDAARFCTIGYGHLVKRAPCDGSESATLLAGLTKPQGEALLVADLGSAQATVTRHVKAAMTDSQYGALCDFVFNVGSKNFRGSTLLRMVNDGAVDQIPAQFRRWILAGGKPQRGLKIRREREIELYFAGLPQPRDLDPTPLAPIDIRRGEGTAR